MKKIIIIAIAVAVIVVTATATYLYQKPAGVTVEGKAAFTLEATQLFSDFEMDEPKANAKYINQVIAVRGTIADISELDSLGMNVTLDAGNPLFGISCQLPKDLNGHLQVGQQVEIKGLCTGKLMDVVLIKCVIENE